MNRAPRRSSTVAGVPNRGFQSAKEKDRDIEIERQRNHDGDRKIEKVSDGENDQRSTGDDCRNRFSNRRPESEFDNRLFLSLERNVRERRKTKQMGFLF
uniref:Uncharacterized protein n=1 Tax=Noccaea caerulescens TaxID=107243 RepID=A0A1J3G0J0_NOCCA